MPGSTEYNYGIAKTNMVQKLNKLWSRASNIHVFILKENSLHFPTSPKTKIIRRRRQNASAQFNRSMSL